MNFNKLNKMTIEQVEKFYKEMRNKKFTEEEYEILIDKKESFTKKITNDAPNGKLYIDCCWHFKDEAKELGVKWDYNYKLNYITKDISDKNLKKLLKLEKRLYGHNTTSGYMDYEYNVKIPTKVEIERYNGNLKINAFFYEDIYEKRHYNFDEVKQILADSPSIKKKNNICIEQIYDDIPQIKKKNINPFMKQIKKKNINPFLK
jgi:hypothetical protein